MKRSNIISSAPPLSTWPKVAADLLSTDKREVFDNRAKAVEMYFNGEPRSDIKAITGVSFSDISRFAKNCLLPANDGRIWGYRALVPYKRIRSYIRKAPQKKKWQEGRGGMAGLLGQTFEKHPEIEKLLRALILKKKHKLINVHEKRIRSKDVHDVFLNQLESAGVPITSWPFNTKDLAKRTINTFMNKVLDESFGRSVSTREEKDARAHSFVGTGEKSLICFTQPYEAVQLDAYNINAFFTVDIYNTTGTISQMRIDRIWLIAMICTVSRAILAYSIVYKSEVNADDVLDVIRNAANGKGSIALTLPNLTYPEGGGLPSDIYPECKKVGWGSLFLDGALAHLSEAVHQRARNSIGFTINWGPVGHFERRDDIERFFSSVSTELFMRLPSTTGSNPHKGRADKAEQKAIQYRVNADDMEQIFAVYVARYNLKPSEGNSFNSPLNILGQFFDNDHYLMRKLPARPPHTLFIPYQVRAFIRGGRQSGRRPYVQFLRSHYTSNVLSHASALIGKPILLEFDVDDMRYCNAYLLDGTELGKLKAGGNWHITK